MAGAAAAARRQRRPPAAASLASPHHSHHPRRRHHRPAANTSTRRPASSLAATSRGSDRDLTGEKSDSGAAAGSSSAAFRPSPFALSLPAPLSTLSESLVRAWHEGIPDARAVAPPDEFALVVEEDGLSVENVMLAGGAFRKAHLELAVSAGPPALRVVHCVMYPRADRDLPLLSLDVVSVNGRITLAVADCCPATADLSLPRAYEDAMDELAAPLLAAQPAARTVPEWGQRIFSSRCVLLRPSASGPDDEEAGELRVAELFCEYAAALCRFHLERAAAAAPLGDDPAGVAARAEVGAAHARYAEQQRRNDKTRRVLEAAWGEERADRYMRTVLFDDDGA